MVSSTVLPGESFARHRNAAMADSGATAVPDSAISWGAIVAGGAAAASLSLILLILGVGLGLSSVSPWSGEGMRAGAFGASTIAWLTVTQLLASALGGYLAGRLRTRWEGVHSDEVYFRDTAHGFLAWAVASLATAALLTSAIGSILGGGAQTGVVAINSATIANTERAPTAYFIEGLFRRNAAAPGESSTAAAARADLSELAEVGRIFAYASRTQALPPEDVRYVAQMVAQRTGLSQPEAEKRVSETYARAQAQLTAAELSVRDAADKARKASAYGALWLFVSLLIGAFFASWAATFGGKLRDD